jgi:hypothetical protein
MPLFCGLKLNNDARLAMHKLITHLQVLISSETSQPTHGIEAHQLETDGLMVQR